METKNNWCPILRQQNGRPKLKETQNLNANYGPTFLKTQIKGKNILNFGPKIYEAQVKGNKKNIPTVWVKKIPSLPPSRLSSLFSVFLTRFVYLFTTVSCVLFLHLLVQRHNTVASADFVLGMYGISNCVEFFGNRFQRVLHRDLREDPSIGFIIGAVVSCFICFQCSMSAIHFLSLFMDDSPARFVVKRWRKHASPKEPQPSLQLASPLMPSSSVPRPDCTPPHRHTPSLHRIDGFSGISQIRPAIVRPISNPLPRPMYGPCSSRQTLTSGVPLPRPQFPPRYRPYSTNPFDSTMPSHTHSPQQQHFSAYPTPVQSIPQHFPQNSNRFITQQSIHSKQRALAETLWIDLCKCVASVSPVLTSVSKSQFADQVCSRLISKFADSTLLKYIPQVLSFLQCMTDFDITWDSLATAAMLDILFAFHQSEHADGGNEDIQETFSTFAVMKALRWCSNLLQLPFPDLYSPPLSSLMDSQIQRKESIPIPLAVLLYWEKCIMLELDSVQSRLVQGAALICVWASLRFSVIQNKNLQSWYAMWYQSSRFSCQNKLSLSKLDC